MYNAKKRNQSTPRVNFKRWKNEKYDEFQIFFEFNNQVKNVTKLKNVNLTEVMK